MPVHNSGAALIWRLSNLTVSTKTHPIVVAATQPLPLKWNRSSPPNELLKVPPRNPDERLNLFSVRYPQNQGCRNQSHDRSRRLPAGAENSPHRPENRLREACASRVTPVGSSPRHLIVAAKSAQYPRDSSRDITSRVLGLVGGIGPRQACFGNRRPFLVFTGIIHHHHEQPGILRQPERFIQLNAVTVKVRR